MNRTLETYMGEPSIAHEPLPLREIHAIRLMIHDETKNMTLEERLAFRKKRADAVMEKYGLAHFEALITADNVITSLSAARKP